MHRRIAIIIVFCFVWMILQPDSERGVYASIRTTRDFRTVNRTLKPATDIAGGNDRSANPYMVVKSYEQ